MVVCFHPRKLLCLMIMSSLFDNTAVIIYGWTPCLYLEKLKHWLNLHHQLNYCRTQHHLLLFMVITNKGKFSKIVCLKILYPSCLYTQGNLFYLIRNIMRMINGSVSIAEEGISPNIANNRELKAKVLVYWSKVLRCFLIYSVLSNHAQMQI